MTISALNSYLRGENLTTHQSTEIPPEVFTMQEVMATHKLYECYRYFLNIIEIDTPSTRTERDMLVLQI